MDLQQFGTVNTPDGVATAMLCIDADRANEYMLQWWNDKTNAGYGVVSEAKKNGNSIRLTPKNLHRISPTGAIQVLQPFTPEEQNWMTQSYAELTETDVGLTGTWHGPGGFSGGIVLAKPIPYPDLTVTRCRSWASFKVWADKVRADGSVAWFRGHGSTSFPLKTSLHRLGRTRLERYCYGELVQFHAQAEAAFNRRFDMNNTGDYATVTGLARHHGVPTPLLDWTASPYIAAFFAFSDVLENPRHRRDSKDVRIFGLSPKYVGSLYSPTIVVPWVKPYVNTLTIGPLHNPRLGAQQGHFIVTNVSDLRSFVHQWEQRAELLALSAVDVPMSYASAALRDLAFMGVTAATMFPGLDGVGRKIRHEMTYDTL
jgi:hypothetical protein